MSVFARRADRYPSMSALLTDLPSTGNYVLHCESERRSRVALFAPHGGCIEPGTDRIVVQGVEKLHGTRYDVLPDRIETGTFACAVAATGGDVLPYAVTTTANWLTAWPARVRISSPCVSWLRLASASSRLAAV